MGLLFLSQGVSLDGQWAIRELMLNGGIVKGKRLVSRAGLREV
jgi:hypothetical protein